MRKNSGFEPWVVTAFDDVSELVFTIVVDAIGEADAKMVACAQMRRRGFNGAVLADRATTIKARRSLLANAKRSDHGREETENRRRRIEGR
jgi:hypothetical protein